MKGRVKGMEKYYKGIKAIYNTPIEKVEFHLCCSNGKSGRLTVELLAQCKGTVEIFYFLDQQEQTTVSYYIYCVGDDYEEDMPMWDVSPPDFGLSDIEKRKLDQWPHTTVVGNSYDYEDEYNYKYEYSYMDDKKSNYDNIGNYDNNSEELSVKMPDIDTLFEAGNGKSEHEESPVMEKERYVMVQAKRNEVISYLFTEEYNRNLIGKQKKSFNRYNNNHTKYGSFAKGNKVNYYDDIRPVFVVALSRLGMSKSQIASALGVARNTVYARIRAYEGT